MKVRPKNLTDHERMVTLDTLYTAAGSVKNRDGAKRFLRDLLTESERIMLGRRIMIARHLLNGDTYEDIQSRLKVGNSTIHRVGKWLDDQLPGYEEVVIAIKREEDRRSGRRAQIGTFAHLKKRYPLHFLLFTIVEETKYSLKKADTRTKKERKC